MRRARPIALRAVLWTALYLLGVAYSDAFVVGPTLVTLFWPAAGVAFAAVAGLGYRWAAIVPVAVLIAQATFVRVPAAFVPFSVLANLLGALAGARFVHASRGRHPNSTAGAFEITAGAIVTAVIAGAIGLAGLLVAGMVPLSAAGPAYLKWVLGDLLGIACIAPTLLLLIRRRLPAGRDTPALEDYASASEKTLWMAIYAASYAFVYWAGVQNSAYALGMIAFPLGLLLWSASRFQPLWTALGTLVAVFVVTSLTGRDLAAFQAPRTLLDVVLLLGFLNLFATLPMILAASINHQRTGARRALRLAAESAEAQQAELERLVAERTRQLDEANRALEHASQTDPLTGLRNRRYLARQLPLDLSFYRREAAEPHSPPHALVFALVDIDRFKRVNDTWGHRAGDEVLQQFGARLTALVRSSDYAARWGDEEFLLVLRPMPSEHAATLGERICRSIAAAPFRIEGHAPIAVTCSVGFAEYRLVEPEGAASWEQLVELADIALYWIKRNGRNGWTAMKPADGIAMVALAARAREGAQALVDAGLATVLAGEREHSIGRRPAAGSDLPLTRDRAYCGGAAGRAGSTEGGMAGIFGAGTIRHIAIDVRSSFWFVPTVLVLASIALALGLVEIGEPADVAMSRYWPRMFAAEAEGARAMLSAIATSMITVAGVVFSITIVALAQASTLYTSRVLRTFMRDRLNQTVLGVFLGVFAYCLIVLRTISGGGDTGAPFVPSIAVFTGLVLAFVALGFLVIFIHHVATSIQASEIVRAVMRETMRSLERSFPHDLGHEAVAPPAVDVPVTAGAAWQPVPATATGYVQSVEPEALLEFAVRHDVLVRMDAGVGEFVVEGRPLAHVAGATSLDRDFVDAFNAIYAVDAYRTTDQDPVFGFRQLVDIALKALSPGINDTTTAVTCLDHLSALLQRAAQRHRASPYRSEDSRLRVIARGPDFADLADLAFGQILESAHGNTVVLLSLLRAVRDVAAVTRLQERRDALAVRIDVIEEVAHRSAKSAHARAQIDAAIDEARRACPGPATCARAVPRRG